MKKENAKVELQTQKMEKENTKVELQTQKVGTVSHTERMIETAVNKDLDIFKLQQLIELKNKEEDRQAEFAFNDAMAEVQAEFPIITKTKVVKNRSGAEMYRYAPIDQIISQTKDIIASHNFNYRIKTEITEGNITVTCVVNHKAGHTETSSFTVPVGKAITSREGNTVQSDSQATAASATFAKRYAFCNAFGIMTGDEDIEVAKQEKELQVDALKGYENKLRAAKTKAELNTVWADLPALAKKELLSVAKEVKKSYAN